MRKIYNVSLSNETCIFDEQNGFDTLDAAINWARGRGGEYTITLDAGKAEDGEFLTLHYDDYAGRFYSPAEGRYIRQDALEHFIDQRI